VSQYGGKKAGHRPSTSGWWAEGLNNNVACVAAVCIPVELHNSQIPGVSELWVLSVVVCGVLTQTVAVWACFPANSGVAVFLRACDRRHIN
jgi:hypothetical protein